MEPRHKSRNRKFVYSGVVHCGLLFQKAKSTFPITDKITEQYTPIRFINPCIYPVICPCYIRYITKELREVKMYHGTHQKCLSRDTLFVIFTDTRRNRKPFNDLVTVIYHVVTLIPKLGEGTVLRKNRIGIKTLRISI